MEGLEHQHYNHEGQAPSPRREDLVTPWKCPPACSFWYKPPDSCPTKARGLWESLLRSLPSFPGGHEKSEELTWDRVWAPLLQLLSPSQGYRTRTPASRPARTERLLPLAQHLQVLLVPLRDGKGSLRRLCRSGRDRPVSPQAGQEEPEEPPCPRTAPLPGRHGGERGTLLQGRLEGRCVWGYLLLHLPLLLLQLPLDLLQRRLPPLHLPLVEAGQVLPATATQNAPPPFSDPLTVGCDPPASGARPASPPPLLVESHH